MVELTEKVNYNPNIFRTYPLMSMCERQADVKPKQNYVDRMPDRPHLLAAALGTRSLAADRQALVSTQQLQRKEFMKAFSKQVNMQ